MRLAIDWITEYAPVEAAAEEVERALTMAGLEVEKSEASDSGVVLDIKVTPNRGDCLSVVGVARELCATFGVPMKTLPPVMSTDSGGVADLASVDIEDPDLCPRYAARIIQNVRQADSPPWMQEQLEAAGMRPLGGVVDVTNYVMLELGQPLHAFDYDALAGHRIVVRRARPGETITTLDGVERALSPQMLMICDAERPVAVAGVMGGGETEIGPSTRTVLLESAHFNPTSVRRTSRALGLRTEASMRFERVVDPEGVVRAADRACQLMTELGLGEVVEGAVDAYPNRAPARSMMLRPERVQLLLGFPVDAKDAADSLTRLGFGVEHENTEFRVTVPSWRPDIVREIDLVEEVGRVVGYDRIPERLPIGVTTQGRDSALGRFTQQLRRALAGLGLQEVVTHSLTAPNTLEESGRAAGRVEIRSALSRELSGLRRSLIPGLLDAMERNARRGQSGLALFEVGKVFGRDADRYTESTAVAAALAGPFGPSLWRKDSRPAPADYFAARGIVERLAEGLHLPQPEFRPAADPRLHPGRSAAVFLQGNPIGVVGELHPDQARDLTVRDRVVVLELDAEPLIALQRGGRSFQELTPFPSVVRDLAPRVTEDVPYDQVRSAVDSAGVAFMERVDLTDVFSGPPLPDGVVSYTLSFTFRATDRTLTEEEVSGALGAIRSSLESACGAAFVS